MLRAICLVPRTVTSAGRAFSVSATRFAPSVDEQFAAAQENVKKATPDNDTLLRLYALFKQGTIGDRNTPSPSSFNFVAKAKWNAWGGVAGLQSAEAKKQYVTLVESLVGSSGAKAAASAAAATTETAAGNEGSVRHTIGSNGVASVELHSLTMDDALFNSLHKTMSAVSASPDVRAVVLRAAPGAKAFTYGLDIPKAMRELGPLLMKSDRRPDLHALIRRWQAAITSVASCPVPVIAAVHSFCIGGGVDLITAADIRISSADAVFSVREARIGIVADLGTLQRLPLIVNPSVARQLSYTAEDIDAKEALRVGLVTQVLPDRAALDARANELAALIASNPASAVRGTKKVMDACAGRSVADGLEYVAAWNAAFLDAGQLAQVFEKLQQKKKSA